MHSNQEAAGSRQQAARSGRQPGALHVLRACCRLLVTLGAAVALVATSRTATPTFFPDDPIQVDDDQSIDASKAKEIEGSNGFDFIEHTFLDVGERRDTRALNVNTVDEVPDSSWFTNRIGRKPMTVD